MNTQIDTQTEKRSVDDTRAVGPGSQLRQARLDLKLAPEDVAHILHLSARQIVALENDDYDQLPGPTYVRGYLRGYAQLLGLSVEPVVDAYNRVVASRKPIDLGKLTPETEIRSDHQLIKLSTVAVVAIVLGLSAVWWNEQGRPTSATSPSTIQEPVTEESASGENTSAPPSNNTTGETRASTAAPGASTPEQTPVTPPISSPTVSAPTNTSATSAPVEPGPRGRLVLQTQAESWTDIRDAHGNRLLYEMIPAGRTVTIEGATPLSIFLGNAEGVRVEFNGQPFDLSRHKRGEIARFTLGPPSRTP